MSFKCHLFINSSFKKFNLLNISLLLILTVTGVLIFFLLVLNIIKFAFITFSVCFLEAEQLRCFGDLFTGYLQYLIKVFVLEK